MISKVGTAQKENSDRWFFLSCLGLYTAVFVVIFFHYVRFPFDVYGIPGGDSEGTLWLQWIQCRQDLGDGASWRLQTSYGYPNGYDLVQLMYSCILNPLAAALAKFNGCDFRTIIFLNNILVRFSAYPAAGLAALWVALQFTKSRAASLFCGLFFAFSSYHVLQGANSLENVQIFLIPLLVYLVLTFALGKSFQFYLLPLIGLLFGLQFRSNAYYAFFTIVYLVVFSVCESVVQRNSRILVRILIAVGASGAAIIGTNLFLFFQQSALIATTSEISKRAGIDWHLHLWSLETYLQNVWLPALLGSVLLCFRTKQRRFAAVLATSGFLLSLLFLNVQALEGFHSIYFKFFGAFRGVSVANIHVTFIFSLAIALQLAGLLERVPRFRKVILMGMTLFSLLYIFRAYPKDTPSFFVTQRFDKNYLDPWEALRSDPSVQRVVHFPLSGLGFESYMAQLGHQKQVAYGRLTPEGDASYCSNLDLDLADPRTLKCFEELNIDAIVVFEGPSRPIKVDIPAWMNARSSRIADPSHPILIRLERSSDSQHVPKRVELDSRYWKSFESPPSFVELIKSYREMGAVAPGRIEPSPDSAVFVTGELESRFHVVEALFHILLLLMAILAHRSSLLRHHSSSHQLL